MAGGPNARRGFAAEDFVARLFQRLGYDVQKNVRVAGTEVDLVIQKDGLRFPVVVKAYALRSLSLSELRLQAVKLRSLQDMDEGFESPIIVIVGKRRGEGLGATAVQSTDLGYRCPAQQGTAVR